ncbi:hypothetical protein WNY51_01380 [Pseudocolwellia sp. AS88]|uniref:hypothetical protein n=1 Tax=Pseudocolwellia sp. AS88 TaxID=3063958 RepID=UPI0026EB4696|nr:hypothetical protein [Pseudocolwellia sp. AS88]MDO7085883.1 hypothetical protein [Pseudocolwellia sp. AS88]
MIIIIIGLIVLLIVGVVVVNGVQQHKAKQEQERRAKTAKFKAIIDESEQLIANLTHLPASPVLVNIINTRSLNAAKAMLQLSPSAKATKQKIQELEAAISSTKDTTQGSDENFTLPDNEQQLVGILQTIKKLRIMLKSEQSKGSIEAQVYSQQDLRLDAMQLKIGVESIINRGQKAYSKEMLGSARQYFEKALQTLTSHPHQSEYTTTKRTEIEDKLEEITTALKVTNAQDAAKKAKDEEDDLDMLFQPKKKW